MLSPYRSPCPRPHPRPHPTPRKGPETDPKQTRNGPKRTRTDPKRTETLGQETCRTKVSRVFRIFVPNFAPNFAPFFPRFFFWGVFVLRFVGDGDQKKFTKNPRRFSMQNSRANTKKIFTKFFWGAGKVTKRTRNGPKASSLGWDHWDGRGGLSGGGVGGGL